MKPLCPRLYSLKNLSLAVLAAGLFGAYSASAVMVMWIGTNGISATTNWSDGSNWSLTSSLGSLSTPVNNAANFTALTAVNAPGLVTINVDGSYGSPGTSPAQSYGAFFGFTNGYHTVFIQPGITWEIQAQAGTQGLGIEVGPGPTNNNNINTANTVSTGATYTNYTTVSGIGGTWFNNGGASTGGFRVEAGSTVNNNHYSILDMSGLGTYVQTNTGGLGNSCSFYVVNGAAHSQGLVYLALTNIITLNNGFQVGYLGNSSNSLPIGVYLGQSNYISTGANNNTFTVGYTGCTNAFMAFNPALLGGTNTPSAYITGASGVQNAMICGAAGGLVPGYAVCDFSGGAVTWIGNSLKMGVSGIAASNTSANGVLTFPNGTVSFNTILVGDQSVSAGAPGVGTINVGTNATLQASVSITLGAVTGATNPATTGTINVSSNGTLVASVITNGGAGSTINMTNANLVLALSSIASTNIVVSNFNAAGATNIIQITSITPFLGSGTPRFHLIAAATPGNLTGAASFVLGPMPASADPSSPYAGYLDAATTPGVVDLVLTSFPPSARALTWTGNDAGTPDGDWDVTTTPDWQTNNVATTYNQFDLVTFADVPITGETNVSLRTNLTPYSITVSNTASVYTLGLPGDPGNLSGSTGLTKQGAGTLILDSPLSNNFTGPITISAGILQVGNNDANGNLPAAAAITDNSVLAYGRSDNPIVDNLISGGGSVVSAGGGTLQLGAGNSFLGNAIATNNSVLQSGSANALGASSGTVVIANGSTYDANGFPTLRSIVVSGEGVNGEGAIINSGGPIYDSALPLSASITLAGDTTFSYPTRWDFGASTGATLSTGGHAYNLTLNGENNSYFEWRGVRADASLANITVQAGYFGIAGSSTLGGTNSSLNILSGASIKLYSDDGSNALVTKPIVLNDEGTIYNGQGLSTIAGKLLITNSGGNLYSVFEISATSLTVSGPLSGDGVLWMQSSTAPLIITGNASAFTGGVLGSSGTFTLDNTIGCGITNEPGATLNGFGTAEGYVDVSGTFVPGGSNLVGTFTAAAGLTIEASSVPVINLTAVTTVGGSNNSLMAVTGNLTIDGPTLLINPIGTLANGTYTVATYTGTLIGAFNAVQTVAASDYILALDTNSPGLIQVTVGGAPVPASFTGPLTVSGTTLTLAGSGGTPSGTYRVYTSTNLATPQVNWAELGSGSFDGSGNFSFPTTLTNGSARYFILEEP
ncbi:MAG TPA: autotransporter-associated beta strand repeat-containing protein [Verrucomicrobiae bacterium]|nr:autotransporter-associated beta strand repeat-containing protein [Verrucomicrobiae bacterium]